jgi:hypothetical protein
MVFHYVSSWRAEQKAAKPKPRNRLAPKDVAILICKRPERRLPEQQDMLERLATVHPHIQQLSGLALEFREALQSKDSVRMLAWIRYAASSADASIARFAQACAECQGRFEIRPKGGGKLDQFVG